MYGQRIRKIDRDGMISTIAGNGQYGYNGDGQLAVNAQLSYPLGLFVTDEEEVLVADKFNHRVRKIDRNGIITVVFSLIHYFSSEVSPTLRVST